MDSLPDCEEDEKDDVFTSSNFVQSRILCSTFYAYHLTCTNIATSVEITMIVVASIH